MRMKYESLRRAVEYGVQNGKKNMIVDLDVLVNLFKSHDTLIEMFKWQSEINELLTDELREKVYAAIGKEEIEQMLGINGGSKPATED